MSTQVAPRHIDFARQLHGLGANVLGIHPDSKKPVGNWKHWTEQRQDERDVHNISWHSAERIGIVNGIGGIRSFDIDGCPDEELVTALLAALGLHDDYSWVERSGSGGGWHLWVRCDEDLPAGVLTAREKRPGVYWGTSRDGSFGHLELRYERNQTIIASSDGRDRWRRGQPTTPPATVSAAAIIGAFFTIAERPTPVEPQPRPVAKVATSGTGDRSDLDAIRDRFDLAAYAAMRFPGDMQKEPDGQLRIRGNGGLIVHPDKGIWYRFNGDVGGDCFDLVGIARYGDAWDRKTMFPEAKKEAAAFANVNLVEYHRASAPREPILLRPDYGDMTPVTPPTDSDPLPQPPRRPLTDLGNSERLVDRHGADLKYVVDRGLWAVYDKTRWLIDDTGEVYRRMMQTTRDMLREASEEESPQERNELAKHALKSEAEARINAAVSLAEKHEGIPVHITDFDRDPWLLNCLNGALDLRTGTLRPHQRDDLISKRTEIPYDATAACPTWLAYLDKVMDGKVNLVAFIRRALGYSLTALTVEQVFFILFGSGSNGKTTFLEVQRALLGEYAQNADFRTFTEKRNDGAIPNDIARMVGARLITSAEVRDGARLSEALIKSLTGGDPMTARFLHKEFFEFVPTHKLWLSVNHRPVIKGTDHAIWRRPLLIPFTVTIGDDEKDRHLLDKLRAELPGVLAWVVEGCREWQRIGLAVPDEVRMATDIYRRDMDTLAPFFEDHCTLEHNAWVAAADLYRTYKEWCEEAGERYESSTAFGRALAERGLMQQKGDGKRGWRGITLKGTIIQSNLDTLDTLDTNSEVSRKQISEEKNPENRVQPVQPVHDDEEGGTV